MSSGRLAVLAGVRTPFARSFGALDGRGADDLGTLAARELILRTGVDPERIDAVVAGNVGQGSRAPNVSRVIALRAGLPDRTPAHTVHRNCASGFEAVTQCQELMSLGRGRLFLALGCESMSSYPLEFNDRAVSFFRGLQKARGTWQRMRALGRFRPGMLAPRVTLKEGLCDPVVGLGMGETAEVLAREWGIPREEQDAFAMRSHQRTAEAREHLREETFDVVTGGGVLRDDDGVRPDSSLEKLAKLRPVFERRHGTVTAGNSSQITDGAVALLVGDAGVGRELGLDPLGELVDYAYAGCDPSRMGLGPVYAMHRLFPDTDQPFPGIDLFEINEAFAAQTLACLRALADPGFCSRELGREEPLGTIPAESLNVNGGAIALGHPVGASGARLVLTALLTCRRRGLRKALVSACVGGGQGAALLLER